jgi:hypothetical protein
MSGTGLLADLLEKRFDIACRRIGFNSERENALDTTLFAVPDDAQQFRLF